eukprot:SAG11_NODE_1365_length_5109_cov_2.411976_3_plen_118_part_00
MKSEPAADATLVLKQFAEVPWLNFGTVQVGTTGTATLRIDNPSDVSATLTFDKIPAVDRGAYAPLTLHPKPVTATYRRARCRCFLLCSGFTFKSEKTMTIKAHTILELPVRCVLLQS